LPLPAGGTFDALRTGCRCWAGKGSCGWLQSRIANRGPVLGRPLWRSGGSVRVRMGNRNAPRGPDGSRNCSAAQESVRRRPVPLSPKVISSKQLGDTHVDRDVTIDAADGPDSPDSPPRLLAGAACVLFSDACENDD